MVDLSGTCICRFRKGCDVVGERIDGNHLLLCAAEYQTGRLLRAVPDDVDDRRRRRDVGRQHSLSQNAVDECRLSGGKLAHDQHIECI